MATLNEKETRDLIKRVYSKESDEKTVKKDNEYLLELSKAVFGKDGRNPDPSLLNQFNNLIVEKADEIAKPAITDMVGLLADVQRRNIGDNVQIKIPQKNKVKFYWSANGSGVDLKRVGGEKSITATPKRLSMGIYYEPIDFVTNPESALLVALKDVSDAKLRIYLKAISDLTKKAVASGKIPTRNQATGSNITYANYSKIASVLMRYGGTPVFVADPLLIDSIAAGMATEKATLISDSMKDELLTALSPTRLGRTVAVNLTNTWTDERHASVELPVNEGFMFSGGISQKPFSVVEFGGLRQKLEQNMEDERIKLKIIQDADILLMFGEALGYVKDDAVIL